MQDAEEIAQGQLDAYNQRDIESFVSYFSNDIQMFDLETGTLSCEGKDEFFTRYKSLFDSSPDLHCKLVKRIVCGKFVYDEEKVSGHSSGAELHAVATYYIDGGLIRKAWFVKEVSK